MSLVQEMIQALILICKVPQKDAEKIIKTETQEAVSFDTTEKAKCYARLTVCSLMAEKNKEVFAKCVKKN